MYYRNKKAIHVVFAHDTFLFSSTTLDDPKEMREERRRGSSQELAVVLMHIPVFMYAICEVSLQAESLIGIAHAGLHNAIPLLFSYLLYIFNCVTCIYLSRMYVRVICRSRCKSAHESHYFYCVHCARCLKSVSKYILAGYAAGF